MNDQQDREALRAAAANSAEWDDNTWAAWARVADRAHQERRDRITRLETENEQLRTELNEVRRENIELNRALGLNDEVAA